MATDKLTHVKSLEMAIEFLKNAEFNAEAIEHLATIKGTYEKKSASEKKPTQRQLDNEKLKAQIIDLLNAEPTKKFTVTQIMKSLQSDEELTNQRVSRLLTDLYDKGNGSIARTEDKRVAMYSAKA